MGILDTDTLAAEMSSATGITIDPEVLRDRERLTAFLDEMLPSENQRKAFVEQVVSMTERLQVEEGIYHGIPTVLLLDDETMEGMPTFIGMSRNRRMAALLEENLAEPGKEDPTLVNVMHVGDVPPKNDWYGRIIVRTDEQGVRTYTYVEDSSPPERRFLTTLTTQLLRSTTVSYDAEMKAREKLKELISEKVWRTYEVSGAFFEAGKSGMVYLLRKGFPTIAFRNSAEEGSIRFVAALCMHPLGYFYQTYVGAMAPTDEVVAHLLFNKG